MQESQNGVYILLVLICFILGDLKEDRQSERNVRSMSAVGSSISHPVVRRETPYWLSRAVSVTGAGPGRGPHTTRAR